MFDQRCPKCGTYHRANARFCPACRAPLDVPAATKTCSQCQTANRADAKFCARCRHPFANRANPSPIIFVGAAVGGVFLLATMCGLIFLVSNILKPDSRVAAATGTVMLTSTRGSTTVTPIAAAEGTPTSPRALPTPSPTVSRTPTGIATPDLLERAERATVQIWVPIDSRSGYFSIGSGTVVTKRGHILTNHHIFVDQNGKPENARGEILIALPPADNLKDKVQIRYRAVMVQADAKNDLALIRISATRDNRDLPPDLGLGIAPIGDSDATRIGDRLWVLGFPGVGGDSLTLTSGIISGFLLDDGFIKTDAEINQGNSGGGAYNTAYQLIGVPSQVSQARQAVGKLGLIRPIKFAIPLIELAKRQAGE